MITSNLRLPSWPTDYERLIGWAFKRYGNPNPYESTTGWLIWKNAQAKASIGDSLWNRGKVILHAEVEGKPYVHCEVLGSEWTLADTNKIFQELDRFWELMDTHFKK